MSANLIPDHLIGHLHGLGRLLQLIDGGHIDTSQVVLGDSELQILVNEHHLIAAALHPQGQAAIDAYLAAQELSPVTARFDWRSAMDAVADEFLNLGINVRYVR